MSLLQSLNYRIDFYLRKKRFKQVLANGLVNELILAREYADGLLLREENDKKIEEDNCVSLHESIRKYEDKFRSYGFNSAEQYISRELDNDVVDLHYDFQSWMRLIITPEEQEKYDQAVSQHDSEIEACRKVIADLDIITPVIASQAGSQLDRLLALFKQHDVEYLLGMESLIRLDRIVTRHYFGGY